MSFTETARLLPYHLRLAALSLRRNPVMTLLMYVSLALAAGVWSVAVTQYTRFNGWGERLSPQWLQSLWARPGPPDEWQGG